ncbi:hypothetical protein RB600_002353 [Gaeumannomyces tritici]
MSAREQHQIFVIARPAPGQHYRCFAVAEDLYLYGTSVLNTCLRLVRIFSSPLNRVPLQQEIAFAREHYSHEGAKQLEHQCAETKPVPFPFVAACLVFGVANNPDDGQSKFVDLQPMGHGFDQCSRNGVTIVDITDLDDIRYCFAAFHDMGAERGVPLRTPLSAMDYVLAFYDPQHQFMVRSQETLKALKEYGLVQIEALNDRRLAKALGVSEEGVKSFLHGQGPTADKDDKTAISLRDMATHKLLRELLHDPRPDISLLDVPLALTGVRNAALGYLIEHASDVAKCPAGPAILALILAGQNKVDLSRFPGLTADGIREVLSSKQLKTAEIINLSGTQAFDTSDDIKATMSALGPNVRELYCLARPDRAHDDISVALALRSGLVRDIRLPQKILLGAVLSASLRDLCSLFSLRNGRGGSQEDLIIKELGLEDLNRLKPRALKMDGPPTPTSPDWPTTQFPVSQLLLQGNLGYMMRPECGIVHLDDGLIGPARVITGLLAIIRDQWFVTIRGPWRDAENIGFSSCLFKVACAFAMEAATVTTPRGDDAGGTAAARPSLCSMEINHPPAHALRTGFRERLNFLDFEGLRELPQPLGPDRWTAIIAFSNSETGHGSESSQDAGRVVGLHVEVGFVRTRNGATTPRRRDASSSLNEFEINPQDLEVVGLVDFARAYQAMAPDGVAERIAELEEFGRVMLDKVSDHACVSITTATAVKAAHLIQEYLKKCPANR